VTAEPFRAVIRAGVYSLILVTPLPFGSVEARWVLVVELLAAVLGLAAVAVITLDARVRMAFPRWPLFCAGAIAALGILQVMPLPLDFASGFVPTAHFIEPLVPFLGPGGSPSISWSIERVETTDALLRFIGYALIAAVTALGFDDATTRRRLALTIMAAALFQCVYGAGEYLSGRQHIFGFAKKHYLDSASGTFISRNHFAGMLGVALPFAMTLAFQPQLVHTESPGWRTRILRLGSSTTVVRLFSALTVAVIWVGLLLSRSRTGLIVGVLGACVVLLGLRSVRATRWAAVFAAIVLLGVLSRELRETPGERFLAAKADLSHPGGRLAVWRDSLSLVQQRPLFGWGLGTFEGAYPLVQSAEIETRYDHAHNEWLEFAVEGGALTLALALALLVWCLSVRDGGTWRRAVLRPEFELLIPSTAAIGVAAGHSLFEFGGRIPAIAVLCAVVIGLQLSFAMSDRRAEPSWTGGVPVPFPLATAPRRRSKT
jgi:O-antigen ligase